MLESLRRRSSRIASMLTDRREERRLARLYSPDPQALDPNDHIDAALDWLKRAQDAGTDRGVSYGASFGGEFQPSYPETTGYICRTFVEQSVRRGDRDLLNRAIQMGVWESEIQMPDGAVMGGTVDRVPTPALFNTGMVMLGWNALMRTAPDERFERSCHRAAEWMLSMQESDGNWTRGNSIFAAPGSTVYNVAAAWALCEAGILLGRQEYVDAAVRNAEFCRSQQESNGWFRNCCLTDPRRPLLHTLAYTMQGLVEIGKLTARSTFVEAARRTADAQLRVMGADGFLSGRQDRNFKGVVKWCCLCGSAQTSVVFSELHRLTGDDKYLDAAGRVNRYLMGRHDIRNPDLRLRGGVPGSWPTWGAYQRLTVVNWATKFLVDALSLEQNARSPAEQDPSSR